MSTQKAVSAPFPDVEAVAEETSACEPNTMLRAGWRLLVVVAAHDGAGGYPVYVLGEPRRSDPNSPGMHKGQVRKEALKPT